MKMTTYYVSSSTGNDNNDGLTPQTAWATLQKVNTAGIKDGDTVLFKCGDTFYGSIQLSNFTSPVTLSSYGVGDKPKITAYKIANDPSSWVQHSTNVWKINLTDTTKFTGNTNSTDANVGFLRLDGVIYGDRKFNLTDLASDWQFYCDGTYLYVYATNNPAILKSDIKIAINQKIINLSNNLIIKDLDIFGTGGHGISGSIVSNISIINCDIHEIGGSTLVGYGDGTTRYGNGIEFWQGGNSVTIEHSKIYDVYDVAFTMQGSTPTGWTDIVFRNNIIWNCTQSFEIWANAGGSSKFINCFFEDNICINAGYGWGYDVRPDKNVAVHLLLYNVDSSITDITLRRNIFYNPRNALYYSSQSTIPYTSDNNYIFLKENQKIMYQLSYTVEQSSSFSSTFNKEKESQFYILTDTPELIEDILSNISLHIGTNNSHLKLLHDSIGRINSKVKSLQTFSDNVSSLVTKNTSNQQIETSHLNGFLKPIGGYVTAFQGTSGDGYALLCKVNIKTQWFYRFDMMMAYSLCADSTQNRDGLGILNMQVVPNTNFSSGTYVDLDVFEIQEFTTGVGVSSQDFVAVIEKENGTEVIVSLYFNIGKDNYMRLMYQPILIYTDETNKSAFTFYNKQPLVATLPAGTQVRPSKENPYIKRPKTGTGTPSLTPDYIGQEYIDTTNKKVYKACGLTSSDWVVLN
jgi:hypothetical protein